MNDSYSAARVHVMRTKLIDTQQYERLLKMSDKEIIGFLQTTEYGSDINAVAMKDLEDITAIDQVIAHNMKRELAKLGRISSDSYKQVLQVVLHENDLWNVKLAAEAIAAGTNPQQAIERYAREGSFAPIILSTAKSIEELARISSRWIPSLRSNPKTLAQLRDALLQQKTGVGKRKQLHPHRYRIDEQNLLRLVMLKREKLAGQQILARLHRGGTVDRSMLREAANCTTIEETLRILKTTKYGKAVGSAEKDSLVRLESELHAEILKRILRESMSAPLHAQLLLRYLAEKEIEHQNIRLLVKGKRLGLEESFIREHLVV